MVYKAKTVEQRRPAEQRHSLIRCQLNCKTIHGDRTEVQFAILPQVGTERKDLAPGERGSDRGQLVIASDRRERSNLTRRRDCARPAMVPREIAGSSIPREIAGSSIPRGLRDGTPQDAAASRLLALTLVCVDSPRNRTTPKPLSEGSKTCALTSTADYSGAGLLRAARDRDTGLVQSGSRWP